MGINPQEGADDPVVHGATHTQPLTGLAGRDRTPWTP